MGCYTWSSKLQHIVSRSSAEAEYRGVANVVAEASWLHQLLEELQLPPHWATIVYCNNISAVYLSINPVQHHHTKHIEIDLHFIRKTRLLPEPFEFFMYPLPPNTRISSPRGFHHLRRILLQSKRSILWLTFKRRESVRLILYVACMALGRVPM
jgi:hypothetical protein